MRKVHWKLAILPKNVFSCNLRPTYNFFIVCLINSSSLELSSLLNRLEILGAKVTLYDAMFSKYESNGELEEQESQEDSTKDLRNQEVESHM